MSCGTIRRRKIEFAQHADGDGIAGNGRAFQKRGKHTTRQSEILVVSGARIIDTCGFSMLELPENFRPQELVYFYDEFAPYAGKCRFRTGCTHIKEPDCAVKDAVENGKISKNRYERYCVLYNELNEKWRKRYE